MSAARGSAALVPHPDGPAPAVRGVRVDVTRTPDALTLEYTLDGDLDAIRIPAPAAPAIVHGLWEHTCFEAFVAQNDEPGYVELNVAPSGAWAVYGFAGYRERAAEPAGEPAIEVGRDADALDVVATLSFPTSSLRVGLTAVIERTDGRTSYWALAHPAVRPDFHHADGFVARVPAAEPRP